MTEYDTPFIPQVGDEVRWKKERDTYTVTAVGESYFLAMPNGGEYDRFDEMPFKIREWGKHFWSKVEPVVPIPERYIRVWKDGSTTISRDRWRVIDDESIVVHIWTDENGEDRIERITP